LPKSVQPSADPTLHDVPDTVLQNAPPVAQHLRLALIIFLVASIGRSVAVLQINMRTCELAAAPSNVVIYIFHPIAMDNSTLKINRFQRFSS
jgi:hypothetical protein